ncbi:hypothetical protein Tco_1257176 [Tanacetum coccineum]
MANLKAPRRLVLCDRLAVDANSNRMKRQMMVHFEREKDVNCADAPELMRLIAESSRTGCRKAEEAEWDGGMVSEACRDVLDNTVFRLAYLAVSLRFSYLVVGWVGNAMDDVILDVLLQKKFNEQERVKDDKEKLTGIYSDEDSTTNEDSSSDDHMTVFKGAKAGSKTLLVPIKRPPPIRDYVVGLVAVGTYAKNFNKEFGIRNPKMM